LNCVMDNQAFEGVSRCGICFYGGSIGEVR
jgi:hypothetical protein